MKSKLVATVVALTVALLIMVFTPYSGQTAAQVVPQGPWIDQITFSEEVDRSKGLSSIIAGDQDTIMFDITAIADKERAEASPELTRFGAFGFLDELTFNPVDFRADLPRNPFAIQEVREAMNWVIDRDFIVREVYGGFAVPRFTILHPRSAEYGRAIADILPLEEKYAYDPARGKDQIFAALTGAGWSIGADGFWHDPEGRLVTIIGQIRIEDERIFLGAYYADVLEGLNFKLDRQFGPSAVTAGTAYGTTASDGMWHYYTAGWIRTANTAFDDGDPLMWTACGEGFMPWCTSGEYTVSPTLLDISETLAFGLYTSVEERQALMGQAIELALVENYRIFIDNRQSLFVHNNRMSNVILDLFGGFTSYVSLRAANVPADPITGLRTSRILNLQMFEDGWSPWIQGGWLYDAVQRRVMTDPGLWVHPHTGLAYGVRTQFTVETAGPTGTLAIPSDAIVYDTTTNSWPQVSTGTTATSKVTLDMTLGDWHHGMPFGMVDILNGLRMQYRRVEGDIALNSGLTDLAGPTLKFFITDQLKGVRVVDADTLEVYLNFWHPNDGEIALTADLWTTMPWEAAELGAELLLNGQAGLSRSDHQGLGIPWLDMTKGDSLPLLAAQLATQSAANNIPAGMESFITAADATARWAALNTWVTNTGNFWPSNGPFVLDTVDTPNRQVIFKADRNYPFMADHFDALATIGIPTVSFTPTPPVVFAGTPAIFDFSVSIGLTPTDDITTEFFLRDVSTGEFIDTGTATRLGTGSYRIELPASQTEQLLLGNFEVITLVVSNTASVPSISRSPFLILPSVAFFTALLDARVSLVDDELADLSTQLSTTNTDLSNVATATSGLTALLTAIAVLAVIAIAVAVVSVVLVLRKAAPPSG